MMMRAGLSVPLLWTGEEGSTRKEDPQGSLSELEQVSVVDSGRCRAGDQLLHCGTRQL